MSYIDLKERIEYLIPEGWAKRWGKEYLQDINNVFSKYGLEPDVLDAKEKYGGLRVYLSSEPAEWSEHEAAWEYISEHTCVRCGKFPAPMRLFSWVSPYCDECAWSGKDWATGEKLEWPEEEKKELTEKDWDGRLLEYLHINYYSNGEKKSEFIDMKPYYDLINWNYTSDDLISMDEMLKLEEGKDE